MNTLQFMLPLNDENKPATQKLFTPSSKHNLPQDIFQNFAYLKDFIKMIANSKAQIFSACICNIK